MIVSASYKTDIPAFYGGWLMNRLRMGYCRMVNPYNRRAITVTLRPDEVDGFVFWTKNLGPFLPHLAEVREMGFPFVVQYTVTGYPRELEFAVVPWERSCEHASAVASRFGRRSVAWRYDPILFTSLTPPSFHLDQFGRLSRRLAGVTDEVVVSFAQLYRKTVANLQAASREQGLEWGDPADHTKVDLVTRLAAIAWESGIRLTVCAQAAYAAAPGARPSRCIDADRLSDVGGRALATRVKGNRPDCECHQSRDIGEYDTCPHGCVYCYAVRDWDLAKARHQRHDPDGEFLFAPEPGSVDTGPDHHGRHQLTLF